MLEFIWCYLCWYHFTVVLFSSFYSNECWRQNYLNFNPNDRCKSQDTEKKSCEFIWSTSWDNNSLFIKINIIIINNTMHRCRIWDNQWYQTLFFFLEPFTRHILEFYDIFSSYISFSVYFILLLCERVHGLNFVRIARVAPLNWIIIPTLKGNFIFF